MRLQRPQTGHFRAFCAAFALALPTLAQAQEIRIPLLYLERQVERPPTLSNLDKPPEDLGLAGARLGLSDNATTGRFLKQNYALAAKVVRPDEDWQGSFRAALAAERPAAVIVNAPAADLLALADAPEAKGVLIFNAGAPDDSLRGTACRRMVLHTTPSRAQRADALAQFAVKKRWGKWFLLTAERPGDLLWRDALKASAKKFNLAVVAEKSFADKGADLRRTASAEMPLFTQGPEHDMVVVADEAKDYAPYVPYNTWLARPVAGSAGLEPVGWHRVIEQWGAAQLQSRFTKLAGRAMTGRDWAAWAGMRAVGEAAIRTQSADPKALEAYIRSEKFELAGFKGRPLSFRAWDGQLRQPIHLVSGEALVGAAPFDGFLHRASELDTLGVDAPETKCVFKD